MVAGSSVRVLQMENLASPFDWGETVRIAPAAPPSFRPGAMVSVCGYRAAGETDTPTTHAGEALVLVEYGDGSSCEVPLRYIVKEAS
jgi:hypothetical protein